MINNLFFRRDCFHTWTAFVVLSVSIIGGCAILGRRSSTALPSAKGTSLVRGYLAVAVGRSSKAEKSGGIYARQTQARDIYLPSVTVYLQDPTTGRQSDEVRTDLSGRFTLRVPEPSRYRLCWKSKVYGDGCLDDAFSAGAEPLFLATVLIRVPAKQGFAASFGKVRFEDESLPRTLEPLSDINSFATVSLRDSNKQILAEVPVNNLGDYLLPYLPNAETVELVTQIEKAQSVQTIRPEAYTKSPRLVQYHLTIKNSRPRLEAIVPVQAATGNRVQVGTPGDTVALKAVGRDPDGDPLEVQWSLSPGGGDLSAKTGNETKWTLPKVPGRYSVVAIVSDKKGGYDRYAVRLLVGGPGVPFSGIVAGTDGKLLEGAEVQINGKSEKTGAQGRFVTYVPPADRYVMNIRNAGYGVYSKIYDRSVAGGRWTLTRATVSTFERGAEITLQDKRSDRNCSGPDTGRINWSEGPALMDVWWQDGKGNNIPPPTATKDDSGRKQAPKAGAYAGVILPWEKRQKQGDCGPGISVRIPPNSVQSETGADPIGKIEVSLATFDLSTPEQMPGDDSVERPGGTIDWMQSFGAGSVDLRDTATGRRLQLKPQATAEVTIPVDPSQLIAGAPLLATAPFLSYDETKGVWREDGVLTLDPAKKNYVAKVTHFSALNTDVVFTNPSCVRVESTITPPYDLEVTIPMAGGAAPKLKKITITDAPPHVIYHLPNETNITLVAIAPGAGTTSPRSLGVFVVNTGPPQAAGFGAPPPPSACATEVTLSTQTFPTQPESGEFLHGLFSFAATTINEADISNVGSPSQQLDQATTNYYNQIDIDGDRDTLEEFRNKNAFIKPTGFQLCGSNVCDDPDQEINVTFANSGDLGFGRDMHCRRTDTGGGTGFDYACYVTNYGDIATDDVLDAQNARTNTGVVATVAMEYSRIRDSDPLTDRHVKFYVYNAAGNQVNRADLDGAGVRPIPQLCMVCHGGAYPGGGTIGVPAFDTPDSVKFGSRFLPFDLRFYTFPTDPDKSAQQAAIKRLNEDIVRHAPSLAAPDPIADVIAGMYSGGATTQREEFVISGWQQSQSPNTLAQEAFYKRVVGNACRTCHIAQVFANVSAERLGVDLQFRTARDFLRSHSITTGGAITPFSSAEQRVCNDHVMPHAQRTHDILWGQYWQSPPTDFGSINPTIIGQFQAFGDTIKTLPRPGAWPAGEPWPPSWDGTLCGPYTNPGTTPPSFYSAFVHPLWSRDLGSNAADSCTDCHSDLTGTATNTRNNLLNGFFGGGSPEVVPNDSTNSRVVKRLKGIPPGARMPQGCVPDDTGLRCLHESGGYDPTTDPDPNSTTSEIDRVTYWIDHNAEP